MGLNFSYAVIFLAGIIFCTPLAGKGQSIGPMKKGDIIELDLKDSAKLTHIKNQFYRSKRGQLFQKTQAQRGFTGVDTLDVVTYFDGSLPQDIDPFTFKIVGDSWFAKDKRFAYSYRPTAGGMYCVKIGGADVRSFKVLKGESFFAVDKNHLFHEMELVKNINPHKMKIIRNKRGDIIKFVSGRHVYVP